MKRREFVSSTLGLGVCASLGATAASAQARTGSNATLELAIVGGVVAAIEKAKKRALIGFILRHGHGPTLTLRSGQLDASSTHEPHLRTWPLLNYDLEFWGRDVAGLTLPGIDEAPGGLPDHPEVDDEWRSLKYLPTLTGHAVPGTNWPTKLFGTVSLSTGELCCTGPTQEFGRQTEWEFKKGKAGDVLFSQAMTDTLCYTLPFTDVIELKFHPRGRPPSDATSLKLRPTSGRVKLLLMAGPLEEGGVPEGDPLPDFAQFAQLHNDKPIPIPFRKKRPKSHGHGGESLEVFVPGKYCTGLRLML